MRPTDFVYTSTTNVNILFEFNNYFLLNVNATQT